MRVGLVLSSEQLVVALIDRRNKQRPSVKVLANYALEDGASLSQYASELKKLVKERGLGGCPCFAVLGESDYQLLLTEKLDLPEDEQREAMRWKIKDLISFDAEQAVIDSFTQPGKNMNFTVVSKKSVVTALVDLVNQVGLKLSAIDIPELACRNVLDYHEANPSGVALVIMGQQQNKILVIKDGQLYFSRHFGGSHHSSHNSESSSDIVLELQRSLDYYERQMNQPPPTAILCLGSGSVDAITHSLQDNFQQTILQFDQQHFSIRLFDAHSDAQNEIVNAGQTSEDGVIEKATLLAVGAALRQEAA